MTLISSVTVGSSGSSSIDFSNIPSTYTDLCIRLSLRGDGYNATDGYLRFNANSGASYDYRFLWKDGNSATATSGSNSSQTSMFFGYGDGLNAYGSTFSNVELYIPNYTSSNYKTVSIDGVHENTNNDQWSWIWAGIWKSTATINQITFTTGSTKWVQYSTAYLYGIKNS